MHMENVSTTFWSCNSQIIYFLSDRLLLNYLAPKHFEQSMCFIFPNKNCGVSPAKMVSRYRDSVLRCTLNTYWAVHVSKVTGRDSLGTLLQLNNTRNFEQ